MTSPPFSLRARLPALLFGAGLLWALYARSAGVLTDFWFDEIWSLDKAKKLHAPIEVLTKIHHDNNHYLVTLWMYVLGERTNWLLYRLPVVLAGIGVVVLLRGIGRRRGEFAGVAAGLFGATSYLLLLYSTEARGYTLAIFFSLLCVDLLQRSQARPTQWLPIAFAVSAVLGFLSHLSFLFPYAGIVAWDALAQRQRDRRATPLVSHLLRWHALPALALGGLWLVDVRLMRYGGGSPLPPVDMALQTLSFALGGRQHQLLEYALLLLTVGGAGFVFWRLHQSRDPIRWFYVIGILVTPAAVVAVTKPEFFFPRYFLTCVPVLYLLLADLVELLAKSQLGKGVAVALLCATSTANVYCSVVFLQDGRGHFLEALNDMAHETPGPTVSIGTNYDLHLAAIAEYYVPQLDADKAFTQVTPQQWSAQSPEWFVMEYYDATAAEETIRTDPGAVYRLAHDYPFSSLLSGAGWRVYHRVSP